VTDTAGNFIQVSPSVTAILGYQPSDMIGHSAVEFIHPDDLEHTRKEMRAARRGQSKRNFETRYVNKEGKAVALNWTGTWSEPVRRHFFIGRDLTEKQAAEAQLRHAHKMDAVGQLTGGVAHDFNNILTVITGTIGILEEAVADQPQLAAVAKLIDEAAERGANLTKHLLAFARKQPLQPVELDVNALVLEAAKLLHPTLGEHIEITPLLAEDAWTALADPNQLATAVLNLAINARDAMPDGGKLALETSNVFLDENYASMHNEVTPGNYVMIAVSDTGTGIPPALLERVFEPFFTTKEVGRGTGLGLAVAHGIVTQHGGRIAVESELGKGSTFTVFLPHARAASASQAITAMKPLASPGGETVLVVEDEAAVRRAVQRNLERLGYRVIAATDGEDALRIAESLDGIDLLLSDVVMPGIDGPELACRLRAKWPDLPVLFVTGYSADRLARSDAVGPHDRVLEKPYQLEELARTIRDMIEAQCARRAVFPA
jgi:PAS domain S-box-containing protein